MNNIESLYQKIFEVSNLSASQINEIQNPPQVSEFPYLKELEQIIDRVKYAKQHKQKIVVVGDYDADGLCSTAILVDVLDKYGVQVGFYIPDRITEGYGLSKYIVDLMVEAKYDLIITVDNGVSSHEAILHAKDRIDIIITDHHLIEDSASLPLTLHPSMMPQSYQKMCGSGVALQIARKLTNDTDYYFVLAMIATIADMVEVFGENRVIIKEGLRILNKRRYPTIISLFDKLSYPINDSDIGFGVVPKINAIGRLADLAKATRVVRYLRLENKSEIDQYVNQINDINKKRKELTEKCDLTNIEKVGIFDIVLDEKLHEGITGLVANRVMLKSGNPTIVLTKKSNIYRGSIRCLSNFNLYEFFTSHPFELMSFGGHHQAAGISIENEKLEEFYALLKKYSEKIVLNPVEKCTIPILADELTVELVEALDCLRPFGSGFHLPLFKIEHFKVDAYQNLKGRYLKWSSNNKAGAIDALYFKEKYKFDDYISKKEMTFNGTLSINEFRMNKKVNIIVEEI